ncbi:MAG: hypothetical protein R2932_43900 [Caldilineaceae bacterium]
MADAGGAFQEQGFTITAPANRWQLVEIKLSELGNPAQFSGIAWQDASGGNTTFYLNNIALVDINLPPTPTAVPIAGPASSLMQPPRNI